MPTWKVVALVLGVFISLVMIRWDREYQKDKAETLRQQALQRMQQDPRQAKEVDREATNFLGTDSAGKK